MKNNGWKYTFLAIAMLGLGYGGWRITEYFLGITRYKYAVIRIQEFDAPAEEWDLQSESE